MFTKLRLDVYDWCQSSVDGSICWLQLIKLNRLCWFSSVCGELPITSLLWVEWYDNCCSCRAFATLLQGYVAMPPSQLVSNSYYDWRGFLPFVSVCCVTKIQCYIAVKLPTEPGLHSYLVITNASYSRQCAYSVQFCVCCKRKTVCRNIL